MNKEGLTIIAKWLEAGAPTKAGRNVVVQGFDMAECWKETDCGTVCCIAGAAEQFLPFPKEKTGSVGRTQLGFDRPTWEALCLPSGELRWGGVITPAWAARCIRRLIATGAVDWEGTREEAK